MFQQQQNYEFKYYFNEYFKQHHEDIRIIIKDEAVKTMNSHKLERERKYYILEHFTNLNFLKLKSLESKRSVKKD